MLHRRLPVINLFSSFFFAIYFIFFVPSINVAAQVDEVFYILILADLFSLKHAVYYTVLTCDF